MAGGGRRTMSDLHDIGCEHEWEWFRDWNNQRYGICKKCKAINDEYRSPEVNI